MTRLDELLYEMIRYDDRDVKRIQHFLKVHEFARLIGLEEKLDPYTQEILEAAAIVHDIGIHKAEEKYGRNTGAGGTGRGADHAYRSFLARGGH